MSTPSTGTNPFPGNWHTAYMPATDWEPIQGGTPDPAAPSATTNYWNPRFQLRMWQFQHPTGVNPDPATLHANLLLPPWIRHNRTGALIDYAVGFYYWNTADLTPAAQVVGDVTIAAYSHGAMLGAVVPVSVPYLLSACPGMTMGITPYLSNWQNTMTVPESNVLHLTFSRLPVNPLGNDTYLFEWFFIGFTFFWRCH